MDNDLNLFKGDSVKALGDGIVEGRLITFTNKDQRDLTGDYFTKDTNLLTDDGYDLESLKLLYHHGLDETIGVKSIGKVIKARIDDAGAWLQAQLDLRDEYEQKIYELAKNGKLGWSSGALPQTVRKSQDGFIEQWGSVEASLTPTEAMPFTNQVMAKSLFAKEAAQPKEQLTTETDTFTTDSNKRDTMPNDEMDNNKEAEASSVAAMDREDLLEMLMDEEAMSKLAKAVAEKMGMDYGEDDKAMGEDYEEQAKAVIDSLEPDDAKAMDITDLRIKTMISYFDNKKSAEKEAVNNRIDDAMKNHRNQPTRSQTSSFKSSTQYSGFNIGRNTPEKSLINTIKAIYKGDSDYFAATKAQNPYVGQLGGHLVDQEVSSEILAPLRAEPVAFQAGVRQTSISGAGVYQVRRQTTVPTAYRPGINQTVTDSDSKFDVVTGRLLPIAFQTIIPRQWLLESSMADQARQQIIDEAKRSLALQIDKEIFIGEGAVTGSNTGAEIRGILNTLQDPNVGLSADHVVTLNNNGRDIKFDDFVDAEAQLADQNVPDNAGKSIVMHPRVRSTLRKMTDAEGRPLFRGAYNAEAYKDVIGYPVYTTTQIPNDVTTGTNSNTSYAFFGAFEFAEYIMGNNIELIVDEMTLADKLQVRIIGYMYSDFILHYPEAFYVMQGVNATS